MPYRKRRRRSSLPVMTMQLGLAAYETILHRTRMMAQGTCSPREYRRMVTEKLTAAQRTGAALARSRRRVDPTALLAPWLGPAVRNARRLRRK